MAARSSNLSGGTGNWSAVGTWDGGASVPANGDTVTITAGDTVVFDVDQSGFANGLGEMTVNGTLKFATTATTTTFLKTNASITLGAAGAFYVGNSAADPIPASSSATVQLPANTSKITGSGTLRFYGAIVATNATTLAADAAAAQPDIVLTADLGLAAGGGDDILICKMDSSTTAGNQADGGNNLVYTVASYVSGTKTVTLAANLGTARKAGDAVAWLSRPITLKRVSASDNTICDVGSGIMQGTRIMNTRPINANSWQFLGGVTGQNNTNGGICHQGSGHTLSGTFTGANNTSGGICHQGSGHTLSGTFTAANNTNGGICHYGPGHTLSGTFTGANNTNGGICYRGSGNTLSGTFTAANNTNGGICHYGSGNTLSGTFTTSDTPALYYTRTAVCFDVNVASATFMSNYTDYSRRNCDVVESFNHGGVSGFYRAWCRGGYILSDATVIHTGTQSLKYVCESASYPVFRDYDVWAPAGEPIVAVCVARKDFSGGTVKMEVIDPANDPLTETGASALATATMADTADAWLPLSLAYRSATARWLKVRITAQAATGNAWFSVTQLEQLLGQHRQVILR